MAPSVEASDKKLAEKPEQSGKAWARHLPQPWARRLKRLQGVKAPKKRSISAIIGLLSAGIALGLSELIAGINGKAPSLVVGVAVWFRDSSPIWLQDPLKDLMKSILNNDDPTSLKNPLVTGVVVVSLVLGVLLGLLSRVRHGFWLSSLGLLAFGLFGAISTSSNFDASALYSWFSAFICMAFALVVLWGLTFLYMADQKADVDVSATRRKFLTGAFFVSLVGFFGGLFGLSLAREFGKSHDKSVTKAGELLAAAAAGTSTTSASPAAATETTAPTTTTAQTKTNRAALTDNFDNISEISPLITPVEDFYLIDTALRPPRIEIDDWSLTVKGLVDNELKLNYEDLLSLGLVEESVTLSCVSNTVGGGLISNAIWQGVPIRKVLDMAGVNPSNATQIVGRSIDGWTGGFPTEILYEPDRVALIAVTMNGQPLPVKHGFPVRLVVAGLYGYVSATKWLTELELTKWEDFNGYWVGSRGWSKMGPVKTQARIDVPNGRARVAAGQPTPIAGVAWAPSRSISKVEVQIGGRGPWYEADLSRELSTNSWRQWVYMWENPPEGRNVIRVRATDGNGETQTQEETSPIPSGATGWHTIISTAV